MPSVVKLDGRGAQLVRLLEDLGHLAPTDVDRLVVGVTDLLPEGGTLARPQRVDAADLRRAAAIMLFGSGDDEAPALEEDWPVLFS